MQEELEQKSVAISIKAGKLTANLLKKAVEKALAEMEKSQKNPKIYKGKQSVKHLVRQGAGVSNIEITDGNIKSFERVARKYISTLRRIPLTRITGAFWRTSRNSSAS